MRDDTITIRQATAADIPELVQLRRVMFESMGYDDVTQLNAADTAASDYFAEAMAANQFHGWLALTSEGISIGSGGLVIDQHPPGPNNLSGQVGYIMNVVTLPSHRRQGIARRVMQAILAYLAEQGVRRVTLHATEAGWPLYRELGFVDGNEMVLKLEQALG